MSDSQNSVVDGLMSLRLACLERLEANADWRALKTLDRAISELSGTPSYTTYIPPDPSYKYQESLLSEWARKTPSKERALSQGDASALVLHEAGKPLPINIILPRVREKGAQVAGADPLTNLSSSLSRDERFVSVRIDGVAHWTFRNDPRTAFAGVTQIPAEGLSAGVAAPADNGRSQVEGR